jgi:PAS domain S-box-containing protein
MLQEPSRPPAIRFLHNLWAAGTAPLRPAATPQEQRQAQSMAFVLAGEALAFSAFYAYRLLTELHLTDIYRLTNGLLIATFLVMYGWSRLGYARTAAWVSSVIISIMVYAVVLTGSVIDRTYILTPLTWIGVQILVVSWVLSARSTMLLALVNMIGLFALPVIRPDLAAFNMAPIILQDVLLAILIVANAYFRQRDHQVIEARTAALAESESRYRTLFESAFDSVLVHRDFQIVDANPALETMTGYNRAELLTLKTLDLITPESRLRVPPADQLQQTHTYTMEGVRKDGSVFPVEVRSKLIDFQGQPARALSVRDLSAQREAESNRAAMLLEQERAQIMRDFIQTASHDLRTPMSIMNTKLYLLERLLDQPEKAREHIGGLAHQVARLSHIIDDMLLLTKLDQAAPPTALAPVDLNNLADWLLSRYQAQAKHEGVHLRRETPAQPVIVLGDAPELMRAIERLLENALHYTQREGRIILRVREAAGQGIIEVEDTGIGIPAEALPHLFKRFYRVDAARGTDTGGAGLGLAIAHRLVNVQGGSITAHSVIDQGSTFTISLPLAAPAPAL